MKRTIVGAVCVVLFVVLTLVPVHNIRLFAQQNSGAAAPQKCLLAQPTDYDGTNCPECVKDNAQRRGGPVEVVTRDFSKNQYYVQPPVVLGDGHALRIDLAVPTGRKITNVSRSCYGPSCGWTHDVVYQNLGTSTATWIGWSNSGDNCILTFTIWYQ
jgi:hypothetical protein